MRTAEAPAPVLRLDTVVADRPRSADWTGPAGRPGDGTLPAEGMRLEATGDPEGAKGDTDAEDSLLRGRILLARGRGARPDGGAGPVQGPAGADCPPGVPADAAGRRMRHARRPEGHRGLQGGAGDRAEPRHRLRAAGRPGEDAPPVRRHQGRQDGSVELLSRTASRSTARSTSTATRPWTRRGG